jgi:hypothetical protein
MQKTWEEFCEWEKKAGGDPAQVQAAYKNGVSLLEERMKWEGQLPVTSSGPSLSRFLSC